jgi:NADH-quinone oxidoreductase subunit A
VPPSESGYEFDLSSYYPIFLYLVGILAFAGLSLALTHLIGPRKKTLVKLMPYESGMDPVGDARQRVDIKFSLVAIMLLIFDVELLFLYPWAVAAYRREPWLPAEMARPVFWAVLVFIGLLAIAYVYDWKKGVFRWR